VRDLTAGRGAEIVLEMSGIPSAFSEGIGMLGKGGRYLIVGQGHNQQIEFNPSLIMFNQATLIGSLSAGVDHYWKALQFLRDNADRFDWSDMLSGPYPWSRSTTRSTRWRVGTRSSPSSASHERRNWRRRRQGPTPTVMSTGTGLRRRDQLFGWSAYWPWISPESLKLATSRS
jgi:hypothetical protein